MPAVDRRQWLRSSAALVAASHPAFAADPKPAAVRFGYTLYAMKTLPLVEAVDTCAAIGYDCVEFALMPGYPTEPKAFAADARRDLRKRLADRRLTVAALMENLPEASATADAARAAYVDRLKAAAELGHDLDPDATPIVETVLGGRPADWAKVKGPLTERMAAWAEVGRAAKAVVAIKPHVANALHTPDDAAALVRAVNSPWLRLAYDHSHFALHGLKLADTAAKLLPLAAFAHVKDAKGTPQKFEFLLPGDGDTDYRDYFARLAAHKYAGPVVVEASAQVFNKPGFDPVAAAKRCYASLAPAIPGRGK